jgi:hypothetical protein
MKIREEISNFERYLKEGPCGAEALLGNHQWVIGLKRKFP